MTIKALIIIEVDNLKVQGQSDNFYLQALRLVFRTISKCIVILRSRNNEDPETCLAGRRAQCDDYYLLNSDFELLPTVTLFVSPQIKLPAGSSS